jgi:pescadillo protein
MTLRTESSAEAGKGRPDRLWISPNSSPFTKREWRLQNVFGEMGLKAKRGKSGSATLYMTRNVALNKLQLRLGEFRRLCILKGVHPREPRRKLKGQNKTWVNNLFYFPQLCKGTLGIVYSQQPSPIISVADGCLTRASSTLSRSYYHVKDINFLLHEPLLDAFRNIRTYEKKVKKAKAKGNEKEADRLKELAPMYTLDHLVRERYPSFIDALRDLDDALTLLHLFATLPADATHKIPSARVHAARR